MIRHTSNINTKNSNDTMKVAAGMFMKTIEQFTLHSFSQ